ncbi:MAG: bifunctional diaminohydroxyphosphoribosylaminopyrimidine deaminase/5-amino-6-(5-phosphoribosylamino)uracil reductase RibD [Verrucomicrobia bacterium]|nr:bifunctional diaminohydroxyphosphoribosylaminopyrimidine deaminase/5-amino-6-(5-phosphoribosylamino)uracil reductase RibD [Verrucomicrobiota bacterium]
MRLALRLARRGYGTTSPNPMVGAVLVRRGRIIGQGWHRRAGGPHAEVEAIRDTEAKSCQVAGATLYVTLEPCSTYGRTPPCTDAIRRAGIKRIVAAATDPNPRHSGRGLTLLRRAGIKVETGVLAAEAERLNEAFTHWIVRQTPFVTVKAAMTVDGKIATPTGESKWMTSAQARHWAMKLRYGADAILAGVNTVLADDPSLTYRGRAAGPKRLLRIILDSKARTPLNSRVLTDEWAALTTIVTTRDAPRSRVARLAERVCVLVAPSRQGRIHLPWLLARLGAEEVTSLLVEGGGEVNASFLLQRLAQRIVFFYAPKIIGGEMAKKAVAGEGARSSAGTLHLRELEWRRVGPDLMLTARVD